MDTDETLEAGRRLDLALGIVEVVAPYAAGYTHPERRIVPNANNRSSR